MENVCVVHRTRLWLEKTPVKTKACSKCNRNPRIGYTSTPAIVVAPPLATALWPNVTQVMELELGQLSPYDNYQL
jgi:hypothetical protein